VPFSFEHEPATFSSSERTPYTRMLIARLPEARPIAHPQASRPRHRRGPRPSCHPGAPRLTRSPSGLGIPMMRRRNQHGFCDCEISHTPWDFSSEVNSPVWVS
jgi:hypothetical protein